MKNRTLALSPVLGIVLSLSPGLVSARPLGFEERIRAQEAIERVYYSGQIGAKAPFETAVSRHVLERKVQTYLEQSAALETLWKTPVTAGMLRREVERMVQQTHRPDRLRELFSALGDDPFLIQECLARPALVDRLARNFFAYDQSIHREARQEIEALRQELLNRRLDPRAAHAARTLEVSERRVDPEAFERLRSSIPDDLDLGPVDEEREEFLLHVPLQRSEDSLRVATYRATKETWDHWWVRTRNGFDLPSVEAVAQEEDLVVGAAIASSSIQSPPACTDDTWEGGLLDEIPDRLGTAVWTGAFMLIWGGLERDNKGWRYDPMTDTWSQISRVNAPEGRFGHTAVWTGDRMIVWGGDSPAGLLNTGGRYDPVADVWTPVSTLNAPSPRRHHGAVWTGDLMLVWGGDPQPTWDGGRYHPLTDTWVPMSTANAPDLQTGPFTVVWSAGRMVLWREGSQLIRRGGRYNPSTNTWASMSITNAPSPRSGSSVVSTGGQMIVWGGDEVFGDEVNTGGRYDPQTDIWVATSITNAPIARRSHSAVWTGNEMMIWGGCASGAPCPVINGGRYSPATNTWTAVSSLNGPSSANRAEALWTGSHVLIWGMTTSGTPAALTGGRYHLATDSWTPISTGSAPAARRDHAAVWTGSHMVIWGGRGPGTSSFLMTGGRYDPALAVWSPTSTVDAPSGRDQESVVWTGQRMIVWGGFGQEATSTGGRYDPLSDSWLPTSLTGAPSARGGHSAVWTGDRMIVWGGLLSAGVTNTGGRYDPQTDTWSATSMTNAPAPRYGHTAVWSGSLMLIWGDSGAGSTGARYDPVGDSWSQMSTFGAPSPREQHGAVWTGFSMIIWGGRSPSSPPGPLGTGGLYDPATNSWTPTPSPLSGQYLHTTLWTGSQMVVWGGEVFSMQGKRYVPGSSSWLTTSLQDAPVWRTLHTAVWTGDRMIVWGGLAALTLNTGARYCACSGGAVATYYQDADGDGYGIASVAVPSCSPPARYAASSGDCDDASAGVHPGAADLCNGIDDDCNGAVDEGLSVDNDGDGFGCPGDCDDFAPAVHPGAPEICDQKDSNCDGILPQDERDNDGDHFATCEGDCRDDLPGLHPGAPEGCDAIDTDCDGVVPAFERDTDGDGFRPCTGDCDDGDPTRRPGAPETCNFTDDDCDGRVDEGTPDADGDGRMDCTDCRPSDPSVWAAPPEATNVQIVLEQGDHICVWEDLGPASGPYVFYDVFAGSLAALRQGGGSLSSGSCLLSFLSSNAFEFFMADPGPPGDGVYILVRGQNPCGVGTYGSTLRDQTAAASPLACP